MARKWGYRSLLVVPMLRDGEPIGYIGISRKQPANSRTADPHARGASPIRRSSRSRTRVCSTRPRRPSSSRPLPPRSWGLSASSPARVQPVFAAILEHATVSATPGSARWACYDGTIYTDGRPARRHHPKDVEWLFSAAFEPSARIDLGRMLASASRCTSPTTSSSPPTARNPRAVAPHDRAGGARTYLAIPLLKDGRGARCYHDPPHRGKAVHVKADRAAEHLRRSGVIAIENVRLFNETKEALEHQQASADILRIVSQSVADSQPAFEAILAPPSRLFAGLTHRVARRGGQARWRGARWTDDLEHHRPQRADHAGLCPWHRHPRTQAGPGR